MTGGSPLVVPTCSVGDAEDCTVGETTMLDFGEGVG